MGAQVACPGSGQRQGGTAGPEQDGDGKEDEGARRSQLPAVRRSVPRELLPRCGGFAVDVLAARNKTARINCTTRGGKCRGAWGPVDPQHNACDRKHNNGRKRNQTDSRMPRRPSLTATYYRYAKTVTHATGWIAQVHVTDK